MAQLINGPRRWKQFIKSGTDLIQDPTYLTFDLDFFPAPVAHPDEDRIFFDSLFRPMSNPGQSKWASPEWSTLEWLQTYGYDDKKDSRNSKFANLQAAINLLVELQSSPWYFQSISGVDQLWKAAGRIKEGSKPIELTVNCLDSIKQPVLKLAQHYRKAIYDFDRLSYTVPDNLRYFTMDIRIFEIRDINNRSGVLDAQLSQRNLPFKNPHLSDTGLHQVVYKLHRCEFDFNDIFSSPANSDLKAFTQDKPFETSFKIKAGWVSESYESSIDSDYQSLGIFTGVMESLEGRANRFLQSAIGVPQRFIGELSNRVQTTIENALIGSAYNRNNDVGNVSQAFGGNRQSPVGPNNLGSSVAPDRDKISVPSSNNLGRSISPDRDQSLDYANNLLKNSNVNKNINDI